MKIPRNEGISVKHKKKAEFQLFIQFYIRLKEQVSISFVC